MSSALVCDQCGFHNDLTRVFCHNCGSRLTSPPKEIASEAAPVAAGSSFPARQQAAPGIGARRPAGSSAPPPGTASAGSALGKFIRAVFTTAILGAMLAALIQMARTPDGIPAAEIVNPAMADGVASAVEAASKNGTGLVFTQAQINNFLVSRVQAANDGSEAVYHPKFVRTFVRLENGAYRLYVEETVLGWPVFLCLAQVPTASPQGLSKEDVGGWIGRLPIHPKALPIVQRLVNPVGASAAQAVPDLGNATSISVTPQQITVGFIGANKTRH